MSVKLAPILVFSLAVLGVSTYLLVDDHIEVLPYIVIIATAGLIVVGSLKIDAAGALLLPALNRLREWIDSMISRIGKL